MDSNILNRLFSTVVKYNNEFMRANYRVDDKTDENVIEEELTQFNDLVDAINFFGIKKKKK
mgnify:CR=1 FL=1